MHKFATINTFDIQLPVREEKIRFSLILFCGHPACNRKRKYSYSIIGKIDGLHNIEAFAEIFSDYGGGNRLKDRLDLQYNRFIFSNVSLTAARFSIQLQLRGEIGGGKIVNAGISVYLKYNLHRFFANGIKTNYSLKNVTEPAVMLLQ
jgi:hypothetical protein